MVRASAFAVGLVGYMLVIGVVAAIVIGIAWDVVKGAL